MISLIVNPTSANGQALKTGQAVAEILTERKIPFTIHLTEKAGHASFLAKQAVLNGTDSVFVVGGDGTVSEVVRSISGTDTALAVIPAGTGNDFVKAAGIPMDWREALDFAFQHKPRPIDSGTCNDIGFANVCGTGFDVMTLDYAASAKRYIRGIWPYLFGVIRTIFTFKPLQMHIEIGNDIILDGKYLIFAVGNGTTFGGGIPIAVDAVLDDGLFDIVVIDAVPRYRIPRYLPALLKGTVNRFPIVHTYRADKCRVVSPNMRIDVDGEIIQSSGEATFVCCKGKLLLHH